MIEGKWFAQGADIGQPLLIRDSVFGRGRDALDDMAQQLVIYREGDPVGTGRLWWENGTFHAGDIGVLSDERGKGYGDLLVRLLIYKAVTHHAQSILLLCPQALMPFFERFGFIAQDGGDPAEMLLHPLDECAGCGKCKG